MNKPIFRKYFTNLLILLFVGSFVNKSAVAEMSCTTKDLNIESEKAVVLFTAQWSGPDKRLIPVLDSVAKSFPEIPLHKIDVDESPKLAKACGLQAVPTIITFTGGKRSETKIGVVSEDNIKQLFKAVKEN